MNNEIWKSIEGYEGLYEVSNLGNVRSLNYCGRNEIKTLKQGKTKDGYPQVNLSKEGKQKTFRVNRLVAQAFLPNPNNLPQVNHKDEDKTNNTVENIEYCDSKFNTNYGTRNERIRQKLIGENSPMFGKFGKEHYSSKPINQYTKDGDFVKRWDCAATINRELGLSIAHISSCAHGRRNTHGGYVWRFAS